MTAGPDSGTGQRRGSPDGPVRTEMPHWWRLTCDNGVAPSGERYHDMALTTAVGQAADDWLAATRRELDLHGAGAVLLEWLWLDGKRLKPREVVAEFARHLEDELDLMREAANASQLRRNFRNSPLLAVPEIHWQYCSTEVMVMERMHGIPVSAVVDMRAQGIVGITGIDTRALVRHIRSAGAMRGVVSSTVLDRDLNLVGVYAEGAAVGHAHA